MLLTVLASCGKHLPHPSRDASLHVSSGLVSFATSVSAPFRLTHSSFSSLDWPLELLLCVCFRSTSNEKNANTRGWEQGSARTRQTAAASPPFLCPRTHFPVPPFSSPAHHYHANTAAICTMLSWRRRCSFVRWRRIAGCGGTSGRLPWWNPCGSS